MSESESEKKEALRQAVRGFLIIVAYHAVLFSAIFWELGINEGRLMNNPDYRFLVAGAAILAGIGAIWLHFRYAPPLDTHESAKKKRQ